MPGCPKQKARPCGLAFLLPMTKGPVRDLQGVCRTGIGRHLKATDMVRLLAAAPEAAARNTLALFPPVGARAADPTNRFSRKTARLLCCLPAECLPALIEADNPLLSNGLKKSIGNGRERYPRMRFGRHGIRKPRLFPLLTLIGHSVCQHGAAVCSAVPDSHARPFAGRADFFSHSALPAAEIGRNSVLSLPWPAVETRPGCETHVNGT